MNPHEEYMRLAIKEAKLASEEGEMPVGCLIVHDGTIIAQAHNRCEQVHDPTAHAEILAIRQAGQVLGQWRLQGCSLYVTLEPCPMCAGAILLSRLDQVIYGAADPLRGCCGSVYDIPMDPGLQGKTSWIPNILEEECQSLLSSFFRARRSRA